MDARTIKPADIRKTLTVKADCQKAFAVFTDGFDRWWPKTHTIGETPLKRAVLEPGVGGRWYGLSEAGVEDIWGEVLVWEPPSLLVLAWRISGQWKCDPNVHTEVEVRFTDAGGGLTRVDFEHRMLDGLGAGAEAARGQMDGGWGTILAGFKTVVEA
ncbi:MAG TPA: SRPBCC family protein [Caulobacteraceae bacterium]|jgi:uncharacterized protein YndB with AHSA1/START domain|nr:SRPBCC family protein [Caulobacteraceae bacterium]